MFWSLLLVCHGRDQVYSDVVACELHVYFDLFIKVIQGGLLNLLVKNTDLWITEMDKSRFKEFIWNIRLLLNLRDCKFICAIVEAKDGGLEYVANQLEFLSSEQCLDFSLSIVVEPQQISILVLILVKHFEV